MYISRWHDHDQHTHKRTGYVKATLPLHLLASNYSNADNTALDTDKRHHQRPVRLLFSFVYNPALVTVTVLPCTQTDRRTHPFIETPIAAPVKCPLICVASTPCCENVNVDRHKTAQNLALHAGGFSNMVWTHTIC